MDEITERLRRIQSDFKKSKEIFEPFGNISEKKHQIYLLIFVFIIIFNKEIKSLIKKYLY